MRRRRRRTLRYNQQPRPVRTLRAWAVAVALPGSLLVAWMLFVAVMRHG
jgi:hypothetical protein